MSTEIIRASHYNNHPEKLPLGEINGPEEQIRVLNKVHLGSGRGVSSYLFPLVNPPMELLGRVWKIFPHSDKGTSEGATSSGLPGALKVEGHGQEVSLDSEAAALAQGT